MRLSAALALLLTACAASVPQAAEPLARPDVDTAPRPYSRACIEASHGDAARQACCALDALIKWDEAPSADPFCERSHGCTNAVGRFIYAGAQQCEFLRQ